MTGVLRIGERTIEAGEVASLLATYKMLPQFVREVIIDDAIAPFTCTPEETTAATHAFRKQQHLDSDETLKAWLTQQGLTPAQFRILATRNIRLEQFKQKTWGNRIDSYYLKRKSTLDKVIYSLIRTKDAGIAQELFFRIQEGEEAFADLARTYSQGPEAQTGGLVGPVELSVPHRNLAEILRISQPGQLHPPVRVGEWLIIVQLEKFIPAQMDDDVKHRLLDELFTTWIQEECQKARVQPLEDVGQLV